ncbi:DUF3168 domain-containing protein [Paracoccus aminophilus]|uniref:Gene transfer agent protein n=1 Tax=Paracoccus aminophilus JCM 7686 TaxID=1367847 RepID=S5Y8P0_PARAH|nr:DUF3168 domain-containing protein [Paracoccus aminophilus]AGT07708.1 hypothetical protein JCM7686_0599 [Paracoccus aminophilus JCM 7686]
MSYQASVALQGALYQALRADAPLAELIGDAVYDAMPVTPPAGTYVSLGPEEVRDASDATAKGSEHDVVISVLSGSDESGGFGEVKEAAARIAELLGTAALVLGHGRLVGMWFQRAKARRVETGAGRRIDLTFRARIDLG